MTRGQVSGRLTGMEQHLYDAIHDEFRALCREFLAREAVPHHAEWEKAGIVDREVWRKAGAAGLLGLDVDEEYGGGGQRDFRFNAVLVEEIVAAGCSGLGFGLHNDVVAPYLTDLTTEEQRKRWLPGFCSGDLITAIAMSEPGAGSRPGRGAHDRGPRRRHVRPQRAEDVHHQRRAWPTWSSWWRRPTPDQGAHGVSLIAVERGTPGFTRGRRLEKVGLKANDTAELFFDDCRVPAENLIGTENHGFYHLMANLPRERLGIAVAAVAAAETILALTLDVRADAAGVRAADRRFQHNRFVLAELDTEVTIARTFLNHCIAEFNAGRLTVDRRGQGQVVDHRAAEQGGRPVRAAARRLRLHARVPGRQGLAGRPGADDLRRHDRDHEGDHRPRSGAVTGRAVPMPGMCDRPDDDGLR